MQQATLIIHPGATTRHLRRFRPVETRAAPRVRSHDGKLPRLALLMLGITILSAPLALVAVSLILGGVEPITVLAAYILG